MIVYGASMSPFVRKVLVAAAEKGIAVESQPVAGLGAPDPEFRKLSPFGKIPALRDGDFTLSDSSAIIHYFEAIKPAPALIPSEPEARARTIWFEEFVDTILVAAGAKIFFNRIVAPRFLGRDGDLEVAAKAEAEELPPLLDYAEAQLGDRDWFVGDGLTLADIALASTFVNLAHLGHAFERHPNLKRFAAAMHARPSFAPLIARERAFLAG